MILDHHETYEDYKKGSLVRERPLWRKRFSWDNWKRCHPKWLMSFWGLGTRGLKGLGVHLSRFLNLAGIPFKLQILGLAWQSNGWELHDSTHGGMGSIPGWGTKIPYAKWYGRKKKKRKRTMVSQSTNWPWILLIGDIAKLLTFWVRSRSGSIK